MQRSDFFLLPRPIQDRFVAATRGEDWPRPLLVELGLPRSAALWTGSAVVGVVALIALVSVGYGDSSSRWALHPARAIGAYVALSILCTLGLVELVAVLWQTLSLPYRSGVYLFPAAVVDATRPVLVVYPLSGASIDAVGTRVRCTLPGGRVWAFESKDAGRARELSRQLCDQVEAHRVATSGGDKAAIALYDPLAEPTFRSPFAPKEQRGARRPVWVRYAFLAGSVLGVAVGVLGFYLRNRGSDARMLSQAKARGTPDAYRAYLERGGSAKEVTSELLPRAELRELERRGDLDDLERYAAGQRPGAITSELNASLRSLLVAELTRISKLNSVTALREFAARHRADLVAPELDRARHVLFRAAFDKYRLAAPDSAPTLPIASRLLDLAEKTGPKIELRFARRMGKTCQLADEQIRKSPFFMGPPSVASQYFDDQHARRREAAAAQAFLTRWSEVFPAEVARVEVGPPVASDSLPAVTRPTLFVEHTVQLSGASYLGTNPRGVFVGLGMTFDVTVSVPDDPRLLRWKTTVWRPPDTTAATPGLPYEEGVYEAMASDAYRAFSTRFVALWFRAQGRGPPAATSSRGP